MTNGSKVSPTLSAMLSDSEPNQAHDAIVIYRGEEPAKPRLRGNLRDLKQRLDAVKRLAKAQRPIQANLFEQYQREGARRMAKPKSLGMRELGNAILPMAAVEVTRKTIGALAEQDNVVAVMPNQRVSLIAPKAVDYHRLENQERKDGLTWGLRHLEVPELWQTTRGAGVNVAVLDTGVHGEHPALDGRVREFVVIDPLGRRIKTDRSFDGEEHGTHVCGTIAGGTTPDGVAIGVAPEASLLVAGVLIGRGTMTSLIEGISWAIENGADVINMSLGFTYYEPLFTRVFDLILERGALPVVAIGNESHGNTSSPGSAYNSLAVGAAEKLKGGRLAVAPFSSGASLAFPGNDPDLVTKPDLVAPGGQIYSAIPPRKTEDGTFEYNYMDGTSMATPHAAGVAALLLAAEATAPVESVARAMKESAHHPDGVGLRPDNRWGHGVLQPTEALRMLRS